MPLTKWTGSKRFATWLYCASPIDENYESAVISICDSCPYTITRSWLNREENKEDREFDLKPGGTWEIIMHGPVGVEFPNTNVFVEIVKPERNVIRHAVIPHYLATAIFEDLDGKTKLASLLYELVIGHPRNDAPDDRRLSSV
ncbi:hypothetical protein FPL14_08770 [Cohnella cholangitidis]|uniref:Activator of Hsp90 ATPase homologue 1/2-like C-terminal domain-containing protein n=1 Tax=Cohnella cholangitidis TaxID=2598458 RepID=A0A7G5BWE1_9BACL|nr:hypothetical protein FPL14_08770 [Cohnella cholangitidis]